MPEDHHTTGNAPAEEKPDKGKQPAVASDDEDDIDDVDDVPDDPEAANAPDTPAASAATKKKKKKSKRKKVKDALTGQPEDPIDKIKALLDKLPENELQELVKHNPELLKDHGSDPAKAAEAFKSLSLNDVLTGLALSGKNAKDMGNYKFWKTQPVPKFDDISDKPIEEGPLQFKSVDEVPKEPQKLIDGFEWVTMDLTDDAEMKEVYQLLNGHYVEDDEAMFRFNYGTAILRWSLMAPGWKADWHVGIRDCRVKDRKPLVAFISAVPMTVRVRNKNFVASEVNFLCVHKKLRGKRLAPILIKEVTRRSNLHGIWQGVYTGGIVLPKPVSTCRYYHRALDWQKLNDVGFSSSPPNSKPEWQVRKYALPEKTSTAGLREMQKKDVPAVHKLMMRYEARFDMGVEWTEEETEHWLLQPRAEGSEQAVWAYVVEVSQPIYPCQFPTSFLTMPTGRPQEHHRLLLLLQPRVNNHQTRQAQGHESRLSLLLRQRVRPHHALRQGGTQGPAEQARQRCPHPCQAVQVRRLQRPLANGQHPVS